ncbi:lantibiotic dehydratase [Couchioplanes caeruleus]|uniref:Lantibiotic dehydratase n=2 Tax=Couchioplanes caeruleus TaxID=56438 RepID=A0A1K0FSC1_9ACTN|nr:lantibiotic dehydratase [Couchioplanes caeruleus]OJF15584.1 Lantibiotic dehydratase [Couchioplanes caeruleus subsp. caeruleus]ROP30274.1 lantibiotic biosynthesis dehydratase-like protein [Couchioplanes caeruleus]
MGYRVEPTFVVRVAGMPLSALARLRCGRTAALVDRVLDAERWLDDQRESLSKMLHGAIGGNGDVAMRRRLIVLRRAVYHAKPPRTGVLGADLIDRLPRETAGAVDAWQRRMCERDKLLNEARAALGEESVSGRRALRDLASHVRLQQGLVLASRDLYLGLAKWSPDEPDPRVERKLAKYVARMAAKTSPFSTFTGSFPGRWHPEAPDPDAPIESGRIGIAELNAFTQRQIERTLAGWPEIRAHLPLEVNSSLTEDGDALRFLGQPGGEAVVELPRTATVRRFLDQVRHGDDRTFRGVVDALAAQDGRGRTAEIATFLNKLIDLGAVHIGFGVSESDPDPLGRLARELERFDGERVATVRGGLRSLRAELDAYGSLEDPDERLECSRAIGAELRKIYAHLGWAGTAMEFPKNVFYEDVLLTGAEQVQSPQRWHDVLDGLDVVRRLAGLYDRFLPGKLAAEAFFAGRYGSGASVGFLDFYGAFCQETARSSGADLLRCYEQALPVPQPGDDRLAELARMQERLVALVAAQPVDADGCRGPSRAALRAFLGELPAFVEPIASLACYVQPIANPGGSPRGVLNELMTGFGRSRARLLRLGATAAGTFTPGEGDWRVGGRHAVEITGTFASNLNRRPPVTPFEISYPSVPSERPEDRRIPLADLRVVHDAERRTLRLFSVRHGIEILPVHLGVMVEFLLPGAYRFLLQMFGQAVPRFEFVKQLAFAADGGAADGVRRYPRLVLGDLTVNRASWTVAAREVPRRSRDGAMLDYLIDVNRWRRRHGIPQRCFVRVLTRHGGPAQRSRTKGLFDKTRKPLYLDFSSEILLRAFEETTMNTDQMLVFEEMLPGPDELVLHDGEGGYAGEFVIELGDGRDD